MSGEATATIDAATAEILERLRRTFQRPRSDGSLPRQVHDKTHACLTATFRVEPAAEPALRHGLFAEAARYPALVRFSNSLFQDDRWPDTRGLAIKLKGVAGSVCDGAPAGQHEILLADKPVQPFRDAAEATELFRVLDGIPSVTVLNMLGARYAFPALDPRRIRWHYLATLLATGWHTAADRDLARVTYYSATPYRLGDGATKYLCRPDAQTKRRPRARGCDFRSRLQSALDRGPLGFDFLLQPRRGEEDPIDDASRAWRGPAVRVGHLEIPPQDVMAGVALGDRLSFNSWHCLAAHEPLGSVNTLRRAAYRASAENRGACPFFPRDRAAPG
ncbi:hypothetical protein SAMN06265365_11328 [Tistlia consotensis]|uniref:Catalase n=1 Tax=Tistlia consotensis USBA 355 TaxID=560819 RepID=A0A1Y6C844_9PROT|nr:hypothetical protein [Tistlia consotensis]SMF41759.1 hypothetical protein SAMN05428998_114117 [Tistlia consotensis USBA 355]SNR73463.1 hypothetical protein SAMN06265365_11328 [Tistlia consotensis]